MSITIRAFQVSDLNAVITLFQASVRQIASQDYRPAQIAAWSQVDRISWEKRFQQSCCWLAVRHNEIAGFGNVEFDGHLDMLFTHPGHQRCGVATALLQRLEQAVADRALPAIFTEASITARPFFSRQGFRMIEAQQVGVRGQPFINYRMRKMLMSDKGEEKSVKKTRSGPIT